MDNRWIKINRIVHNLSKKLIGILALLVPMTILPASSFAAATLDKHFVLAEIADQELANLGGQAVTAEALKRAADACLNAGTRIRDEKYRVYLAKAVELTEQYLRLRGDAATPEDLEFATDLYISVANCSSQNPRAVAACEARAEELSALEVALMEKRLRFLSQMASPDDLQKAAASYRRAIVSAFADCAKMGYLTRCAEILMERLQILGQEATYDDVDGALEELDYATTTSNSAALKQRYAFLEADLWWRFFTQKPAQSIDNLKKITEALDRARAVSESLSQGAYYAERIMAVNQSMRELEGYGRSRDLDNLMALKNAADRETHQFTKASLYKAAVDLCEAILTSLDQSKPSLVYLKGLAAHLQNLADFYR